VRQSRQTVDETEIIGAGILENLAGNREKIQSVHGKVQMQLQWTYTQYLKISLHYIQSSFLFSCICIHCRSRAAQKR